MEQRLLKKLPGQAFENVELKSSAANLREDPKLPRAALDIQEKFRNTLTMIGTNPHTNKHGDFWRQKRSHVEDSLEKAASGNLSWEEVRTKVHDLEDAFFVYAVEIPDYVARKNYPQVEMMEREKALSPSAAKRWKEGIEAIINSKSIEDRRLRLKYLEEDYENLKTLHQQHLEIKKTGDALQKLSKGKLPANGDFPLIWKKEDKVALELFQKQMELGFDMQRSMSMKREDLIAFGQKLKQKLEEDQQKELTNFQKALAEREKITQAFKKLGWLESIPVFGNGLNRLQELAKGSGPSAKYAAEVIAKFALPDLEKAQTEGIAHIRKERQQLQQKSGWNESSKHHKNLLKTLSAIPAEFRTPEMNAELKLITANIEKCALGMDAKKFSAHVTKEFELTAVLEKTSPPEALAVYEKLEALCRQRAQGKSADVQAETAEVHSKLQEKIAALKGGKKSNLKQSSKSFENMSSTERHETVLKTAMREEGYLLIAWIMQSQQHKTLREQGKADAAEQTLVSKKDLHQEAAEQIKEDRQALHHKIPPPLSKDHHNSGIPQASLHYAHQIDQLIAPATQHGFSPRFSPSPAAEISINGEEESTEQAMYEQVAEQHSLSYDLTEHERKVARQKGKDHARIARDEIEHMQSKDGSARQVALTAGSEAVFSYERSRDFTRRALQRTLNERLNPSQGQGHETLNTEINSIIDITGHMTSGVALQQIEKISTLSN